MAHGTPDWGVTAGAVTTYQLTDLGELAARLGSIVTFDRRGDVVFLDSFEDGLVHWLPSVAGAGSVADLTTAKTRHGLYAARLVAGAAVGRYGLLEWYGAVPVMGRFGWECSFSLPSTIGSLDVILGVRDGTTFWRGWIQWDDATNELKYVDAAYSYQVIRSGVELDHNANTFHVLKVVLDVEAGEYVRVILDDTEDDLSGIPCYQSASTWAPLFLNSVQVSGRAAATSTVYLDSVILTQNEPPQP